MKHVFCITFISFFAVVGLQAAEVPFVELKFTEMKDESIYGPVIFSPDGKKIVVGSQYSVTIDLERDRSYGYQEVITRVFDTESGKQLQRLEGSFGGMTSDGRKIAIGKMTVVIPFEKTDYDVRIMDIETGKELLQVNDAFFNSFSPDGKKIIVRNADNDVNEIRILEIETGRELQKFEGIFGARFSPDGKQLLTMLPLYGNEQEVKILDAESGEELRRLEGISMWGFSHGFSPDGKQIVTQSVTVASGQPTPMTLIWDAESGVELQRLDGFFWGFSLDGKKIVTLKDFPRSDTARIWDSRSGRELPKMEEHVNLEPSSVFSADGKVFFPFGLYNTDQSRVWQRFRGTDEVRLVTCSPDGKKIVTVEDYKTARIWDISAIIDSREDTP
jgi:WD40 repeat protein